MVAATSSAKEAARHANSPCRIPARAGGFALVEAVAEQPEAAALAHPRPGNSRASAARPTASRHHSGAMRSGPSARATLHAARRQRKRDRRAVRHLGHRLDRLRRIEQLERAQRRLVRLRRRPGDRARKATARRDIGRRRAHGIMGVSAPRSAARGRGRSARPAGRRDRRPPRPRRPWPSRLVWTLRQRLGDAAREAGSTSKPKPGSSGSASVSSLSRKSRSSASASREGAPVSTASRADGAVAAKEARFERAAAFPARFRACPAPPRSAGTHNVLYRCADPAWARRNAARPCIPARAARA